MTKKKDISDKKKEGRPVLFDDPAAMRKKMEEYFTNCPDKRRVITDMGIAEVPCITISGLILHLGFNCRETFYAYEEKSEFSDIIKKARLMVQKSYEQMMHDKNCTGAIFALKNMGWRDNQTDVTINYDKPSTIIIGKESKN